jgi:excisionase family DNA binding protein
MKPKEAAALVYTVKQACKALQISEKPLYRALKRGDIPSVRIGGKILIGRERLKEWVNKQVAG